MNEILRFATSRIKPCPSKLIITPTQTILRTLREALKSKNEELSQLQLIADSIPLHVSKSYSVLGPVIGKAAIYAALEPLIKAGINKVHLLSVAGAKTLQIGEIVHPNNFKFINCLDTESSELTVLTVDNPYLESESFFETYNCNLIDMEGAAIAEVCKKYSINFTSSFCISDTWNETWKHGFKDKNFQDSLKTMVIELTNHF